MPDRFHLKIDVAALEKTLFYIYVPTNIHIYQTTHERECRDGFIMCLFKFNAEVSERNFAAAHRPKQSKYLKVLFNDKRL